jgi:hypothetical protein
MAQTTQIQSAAGRTQNQSFRAQIPIQSISDPGCYVCSCCGHLWRVPEDGVGPGRSPVISITGSGPLYATKISDNPWIPLTTARALASSVDCLVNF